MEKQLMDKIRNHTTDDIDKDMIIARLKKTHRELRVYLDSVSETLEKLSHFCEENRDEMRLLEFRLCFAFDDALLHKDVSKNNGVPCLCAYGASDDVRKLAETILKAIDE